MKQEFLTDFQKEVMALLPLYTWNDITWESILVRGMKADRALWMQSGKPPLLDPKQWETIYDKIQELKVKHHIDTDNTEQNAARIFQTPWQNFDDPYSLFRFVRESVPSAMHAHENGTYATLKSDIQGHLDFESGRPTENLFYNVHLPKGDTLHVLSNHVVVKIGEDLFSIKMGEMSKDQLKNEMVYRYQNGKSEPFIKYKDFMRVCSESSGEKDTHKGAL